MKVFLGTRHRRKIVEEVTISFLQKYEKSSPKEAVLLLIDPEQLKEIQPHKFYGIFVSAREKVEFDTPPRNVRYICYSEDEVVFDLSEFLQEIIDFQCRITFK